MKKVGLTGGIGSGKSTVLAEFAKLGVPIFSADKVAGSYYSEPAFLDKICALFGTSVFNPDGSANKQAIARMVFGNPRLLNDLNALIHPRVIADFEQFCQTNEGQKYVLFESAILYEYGFDKLMDAVIGVYLDYEERIARTMLRDGVSRTLVEQRIKNQSPAENVLHKADFIILNYEGNPRTRQVAYINSMI